MSINDKNGLDVVSAFDNYFNPERALEAEQFANGVAKLEKDFPKSMWTRYPDCRAGYNEGLQALKARYPLTPAPATNARISALRLRGIQGVGAEEACASLQARAQQCSIPQGSDKTENALQLVDALEVVSCYVLQNHFVKSDQGERVAQRDQEQLEQTIYHLENLRASLGRNVRDQEAVNFYGQKVVEDLTRLPTDSLHFRDGELTRVLHLAKERLPEWLQPEVKREEPVSVLPEAIVQQLPTQPAHPPAQSVRELADQTSRIPVVVDEPDMVDCPGIEDDVLVADNKSDASVSVRQYTVPVNRQQGDQSVVPHVSRNSSRHDQETLAPHVSGTSQASRQEGVDHRGSLISYFPEISQANSETLRRLLGIRDVASLSQDEIPNLLKSRAIEVLKQIKQPRPLHLTSRSELGEAVDALELFCLYATHSQKAFNGNNAMLIRQTIEALEVLRGDALLPRSISKQTIGAVLPKIKDICTLCLDQMDREDLNGLVRRSSKVLEHYKSRL